MYKELNILAFIVGFVIGLLIYDYIKYRIKLNEMKKPFAQTGGTCKIERGIDFWLLDENTSKKIKI